MTDVYIVSILKSKLHRMHSYLTASTQEDIRQEQATISVLERSLETLKCSIGILKEVERQRKVARSGVLASQRLGGSRFGDRQDRVFETMTEVNPRDTVKCNRDFPLDRGLQSSRESQIQSRVLQSSMKRIEYLSQHNLLSDHSRERQTSTESRIQSLSNRKYWNTNSNAFIGNSSSPITRRSDHNVATSSSIRNKLVFTNDRLLEDQPKSKNPQVSSIQVAQWMEPSLQRSNNKKDFQLSLDKRPEPRNPLSNSANSLKSHKKRPSFAENPNPSFGQRPDQDDHSSLKLSSSRRHSILVDSLNPLRVNNQIDSSSVIRVQREEEGEEGGGDDTVVKKQSVIMMSGQVEEDVSVEHDKLSLFMRDVGVDAIPAQGKMKINIPTLSDPNEPKHQVIAKKREILFSSQKHLTDLRSEHQFTRLQHQSKATFSPRFAEINESNSYNNTANRQDSQTLQTENYTNKDMKLISTITRKSPLKTIFQAEERKPEPKSSSGLTSPLQTKRVAINFTRHKDSAQHHKAQTPTLQRKPLVDNVSNPTLSQKRISHKPSVKVIRHSPKSGPRNDQKTESGVGNLVGKVSTPSIKGLVGNILTEQTKKGKQGKEPDKNVLEAHRMNLQAISMRGISELK